MDRRYADKKGKCKKYPHYEGTPAPASQKLIPTSFRPYATRYR